MSDRTNEGQGNLTEMPQSFKVMQGVALGAGVLVLVISVIRAVKKRDTHSVGGGSAAGARAKRAAKARLRSDKSK